VVLLESQEQASAQVSVSHGIATGFVSLVVLLPVVLSFLSDLLQQPREARTAQHLFSAFRRGGRQFAQAGLTLGSRFRVAGGATRESRRRGGSTGAVDPDGWCPARKTLAPDSGEARSWLDRFQAECQEHARVLRMFMAPGEPSASQGGGEGGSGNDANRSDPSLRELATAEAAAPGPEPGGRARAARALLHQLEGLARRCTRMAEMDFGFLFDNERKLFTIGYNVSDRCRDGSFYDLLASEARLCSYFCVARGLVNQEHWFLFRRLLGEVDGEPVLMSWSGSMFEYLMPLLVMPTYDNTLLDQTYRAAVAAQVRCGRSLGIPWGISESGYQAIDAHGNYQYRAFGAQGLGFKRGLADDIVVAPYASLLALMVDPLSACENLQVLAREGCVGRFGFYEAVD